MPKERKPGNGKNPPDIYHDLRNQILTLDPAEVGMTPTAELPNVWGVLMETAYPEAVASLVSLADGTTSLYFSTGGGMIGGGLNAQVAGATRAFVAAAERFFQGMPRLTSAPLPAPGRVCFHVLTHQGLHSTEADEVELGDRRHALSPLFYAGQDVITQLRLMRETKK